jgi:hypothetical protein
MYKERETSAPTPEPPIDIDDFGTGLLFEEPEQDAMPEIPESSLPETEIPLQVRGTQTNITSTTEMNAINNIIQTPVKQRKVSKIIVLFDDGSYQEM